MSNAYMRFLVSTTTDVLVVGPGKTEVLHVHSGRGLYYGLAADARNRIYVACRNATKGPDDEAVRAAEEGSILVFDSAFRLSEVLQPPFAMRDVHGIAMFDNKLWVTCSFDNMIAIYDCGSSLWSRWYPDPNETVRDVYHFNTVRFVDGQMCLVAHRYGDSQLMMYDYPELKLRSVTGIGRMAHDVFHFQGALAVSSSGEGELVNIKGDRLRTGEFPRGVAITRSGNLVGISASVERRKRANQSPVLRWFTTDWLPIVDLHLPGTGMVFDVLPLEEDQYSFGALHPWDGAYAETVASSTDRGIAPVLPSSPA